MLEISFSSSKTSSPNGPIIIPASIYAIIEGCLIRRKKYPIITITNTITTNLESNGSIDISAMSFNDIISLSLSHLILQ